MSSHNRGIARIHLAVFLFGFSGLFGKFLTCSPFFIVFGRTFFAALALAAVLHRQGRSPIRDDLSGHLVWYLCQGILLAVHWWAFFHSIQLSTVAIGLITFSTFPLFTTFLEPVFFREPLTRSHIGTAIAVFIGIVMVVPDLDFSNQYTAGGLWGIFSGLTFALLAMVNRKNVQSGDPVMVSFFQNLFAAGFLVWPLIFFQIPFPGLAEIGLLIILGVIFTALAHTLFIGSLSSISARTASVITGLEPVYAIILAFFLLNEIPDMKTLAGGIIIISAAVTAGRQERSEKFS